MKESTKYTRRVSSSRPFLIVATMAVITAPACKVIVDPGTNDDGTGGTVATGGTSADGASGGAASFPGSGGSTGGTISHVYPSGGTDFAEGGGAGSSGMDFAWLREQGEQCEPSAAVPTELPSSSSLCSLLEIGLPGVLEYSIDPSAFNLDRTGQGGLYEYEGCDEVGAPCVGRLEYDWEVEYLADNEWYVAITPVHTACDYDHALLHELPTGELSARGTLTWAPIELTLHLQPFNWGLTVGAVRSVTDEIIEVGSFTEMEYNGGWPEEELRGLFDEAFIEHLKSIEWQCAPN